jgi:hypothetical protein
MSDDQTTREGTEADTLRTYAAVFELPWRDRVGGELFPPTEACVAAAKALRFLADAIERSIDTSDIPEAGEGWFKKAKLVLPRL